MGGKQIKRGKPTSPLPHSHSSLPILQHQQEMWQKSKLSILLLSPLYIVLAVPGRHRPTGPWPASRWTPKFEKHCHSLACSSLLYWPMSAANITTGLGNFKGEVYLVHTSRRSRDPIQWWSSGWQSLGVVQGFTWRNRDHTHVSHIHRDRTETWTLHVFPPVS